jgi:RNA polymerase sigma-70 factor, ECF subfamily
MSPRLGQKPGVDRAFERLYRHHAADVYRYALAVLHNQADAEDVTQTTFMNAYRALERGDTPRAPHNWLIAIAHNVCRQRFRTAARRVQEVGFDEDVADQFVRAEDDDAPTSADVRRALGHLAFNQRAALVMRELEGRPYAEIAELLEVSVTAVETLIFRARRALREQLDVALTCGQAEPLLSRELDGRLTKSDRGHLRAHLRECSGCRTLARRQRAQRSALRALGAIPLPSSLASLVGGGASVGAAVAVKAAAVVVAAGVIGGVGYDVHHALAPPPVQRRPHVAVGRPVAARTRGPQVAVTAAPAAAAAVVARRPATPRVTRRRADSHAAGILHEPASSADAPAEAAPAAARTTHGAIERRRSDGKTTDNGRAHLHGAGEPPPPQSGRPAGTAGNPRSHAKHGPLPVLPAIALDGLTQTSQNGGARNDAVRHLHP